MTSGVYKRKQAELDRLKIICHYNKGKKKPIRSLQHRLNLGKSAKGRMSPMKDKKHSEESKKKMSKAKIGNKNAHGKLGKIYGRKEYGRCYRHYTTEYKQWRSDVFQRDNWICQTCGVRGGYLEIHHLKSWAGYPELRLVLDNGITLCGECHKLTNNYKNKNNVNKEI